MLVDLGERLEIKLGITNSPSMLTTNGMGVRIGVCSRDAAPLGSAARGAQSRGTKRTQMHTAVTCLRAEGFEVHMFLSSSIGDIEEVITNAKQNVTNQSARQHQSSRLNSWFCCDRGALFGVEAGGRRGPPPSDDLQHRSISRETSSRRR